MTAPSLRTGSRFRLVVLALALFVYLTVELFPIGALPQIADGLQISTARVGLLLTAYAIIAGIATLPAIWATRRWDRRTVLTASMTLLAASQLCFALAPDYLVAAASRALAALAHGLLWSQVPVIAARFAPSGQHGKATAAVFVGSSLALVAGAPLSAALAGGLGWRVSAAVLAVLAAATAVLTSVAIPRTPPEAPAARDGRDVSGRVVIVCVVTVILVVGHYISYSFLSVIVRPAGITDTLLVLALAAYGVAGLAGVAATGRYLDSHGTAVALTVCVVLVLAVGGLGLTRTAAVAFGLVSMWGAAAAALPVVLQTAALRVPPGARDTASGAYVVAYQIGIGGGSALGATLIDKEGAATLLVVSALVLLVGTAVVATGFRFFGSPAD